MRYVRNYNSFIKESKREIDKNAFIVEKQVLNDFSSNFWSLCLRSSIFTNEEKSYIESNLTHNKVSLLNEEWKWLDKAVDWAKDKGEKTLNILSDKIKSVKNGLKDFVSSMVALAKKLFLAGINSALLQAAKLKEKISGNGKIKKQIQDLDVEKSKNEIEDLKKTFKFWAPGEKASESKPYLDKVAVQVDKKIKSAEGEAFSSTDKNLTEAEELKNESILSIIYSTGDDVLESFYNISLISESQEKSEGVEKKTTGQKCIDWLLGFIGQEKMDPEAKTGKKLFWWGKLFLKVLATCLSPILKVVESLVKTGANVSLKVVSKITHSLGGPGPWEFVLLSGLCGGIIGLIYDSIMLFGGEVVGAGTMAVVKKWLAQAVNESLELFPSYKTLKYIMAGFCAGMTLWHVIEEVNHLSHSGHIKHKEGEEKTISGENPALS